MGPNNNFITRLKISSNEKLCSEIRIDNFKELGNKLLKNLQIAITPKIQKTEKQTLLNKYLDHPMFGGHAGVSRMLEKLKKDYAQRQIEKSSIYL